MEGATPAEDVTSGRIVPAVITTLRIAAMLATFVAVAVGQSLPQEPPHEWGESITGAFEGWFKNPDGSHSLLLGYYNRNRKQEVDVPIGTDNRCKVRA